MGLPKSPFFSIYLLLLATFSFFFHPNAASDFSTFIFKGCSQQTFTGNSAFQQSISTFFDALISQSATTRFSKTNAGSGQTAISGFFQCRGDLSNADCNSCIRKIPDMFSSLCGNAVAARVQLAGCYAVYQINNFPQIPGTQMLYKSCSSSEGDYEEKRDTAFAAVESGIAGGSGFYATAYASVYVIAQCEGDLSVADCGECVKEAVQKAQVECGKSTAGQMYLNRCYLSYSYYSNGVSQHSSSSGPEQQQTGKTVAIVVGGAAALGFGVICFLFLRSVFKKRDDD